MPQSVQYVARRSLATGHTLGALYSMNLDLKQKDRKRDPSRTRHLSLAGSAYTIYNRGDTLWVCRSAPVQLAVADLWREFLDSVEDGQVFFWDPTHWAGSSPSALRSVVIESDGYTEDRVARQPNQSDDYYEFGFTLREQS